MEIRHAHVQLGHCSLCTRINGGWLFIHTADEQYLYKCPDRLRLPLIFYLAHPATLYVNKLLLASLISVSVCGLHNEYLWHLLLLFTTITYCSWCCAETDKQWVWNNVWDRCEWTVMGWHSELTAHSSYVLYITLQVLHDCTFNYSMSTTGLYPNMRIVLLTCDAGTWASYNITFRKCILAYGSVEGEGNGAVAECDSLSEVKQPPSPHLECCTFTVWAK